MFRALASGILAIPGAAMAQSPPAVAAAQSDPDATYRTLVALIDEMVEEKLITRAKADTLMAKAQARGSPPPAPSQLAVATPSSAGDARGAPDPGAKSSPVGSGPIRVAGAETQELPADLMVDWSRGAPVFTSRDGRFSFKPRGRILADVSGSMGSNYALRNITVSALRQFRFGAVGTIGDHLFYQFETDFRRNQTEVTNTFVGYRTRIGKVDADLRAGSLLTDRGIDVATAAPANPFITLNVNSTALAPQGKIFIMGVAARAGGENWHATLALHGDAVDADNARNDNRVLMARAHWNPLVTERSVIHVGGWIYNENIPRATATTAVNQAISGAINTNIRVESATLVGATGSTAYGLELGGTFRPFYLFGEYGERRVRGGPGAAFNRATFKALSINGGWWVTGEKPTYQTRSGTYVAPKILSPILDKGGWGGVELVGRYERLDFSDVPLGGEGSAITIGANWYLTNYFRLMGDYVHWRTDNITGAFRGRDIGDTFTARAEVAF